MTKHYMKEDPETVILNPQVNQEYGRPLCN
jgi:hypothetical protein